MLDPLSHSARILYIQPDINNYIPAVGINKNIEEVLIIVVAQGFFLFFPTMGEKNNFHSTC